MTRRLTRRLKVGDSTESSPNAILYLGARAMLEEAEFGPYNEGPIRHGGIDYQPSNANVGTCQ